MQGVLQQQRGTLRIHEVTPQNPLDSLVDATPLVQHTLGAVTMQDHSPARELDDNLRRLLRTLDALRLARKGGVEHGLAAHDAVLFPGKIEQKGPFGRASVRVSRGFVVVLCSCQRLSRKGRDPLPKTAPFW